jgi:asparagine synthase (glutamine-hydrolysing)
VCGIGGIIGRPDPAGQRAAVERMVARMRHRGPDDRGVEQVVGENFAVTLGAARLAIIDLSPAGHMPMADEATGNLIVFNGEIYNFRELRRELEARGEAFRSGTDTEVILRAYKHWGPATVGWLRGMFAFAIWDARNHELFLARDRLGKKPLYYASAPGLFIFASEVRAVVASGLVPACLDPEALEVYLWNGFVVSPLTMVAGVRSLLPGWWLRVGPDGAVIEAGRYWRLPEPVGRAAADGVDGVRAELEEAVRLRLVSDVPLGIFLSGGLDSSTSTALAARAGGPQNLLGGLRGGRLR